MTHNSNLYAINKANDVTLHLDDANKEDSYICPSCKGDVIYRKGDIRKPYFAHKHFIAGCSRYSEESQYHRDAKVLLETFVQQRTVSINISRKCIACTNPFLWDYGKMSETSSIVQEHPFQYKDSIKRADLAIVDRDGKIECIFEICHTNPTQAHNRPEPWFEFDAQTLCDQLRDVPESQKDITLTCIRNQFTIENKSYGMCVECDLNKPKTEEGVIYFNQRGAGCGKTYESIQLITADDRFTCKDTFIYLTKMRSAKEVIYNEFQSQMNKQRLPLTLIVDHNSGNQYFMKLARSDGTEVTVIIGTMDSFTYAVRDRNKIISGNDYFQQLVKSIRDGNLSIGSGGMITYAAATPFLTKQCLIVIDEGQDLQKEYSEAFEKIIDKTGIDTYIIGDKLQSILSDTNLFTHLANASYSPRIKRSVGKNIIKRCHNRHFQDFINDVVSFKAEDLPPVEGVCSGEGCGYMHEDTDGEAMPYTVDPHFKTASFLMDDILKVQHMEERWRSIENHMKEKIKKHGYLPENFMYIFPIVQYSNELLAFLHIKLEEFWVDFFEQKDSYTELILENMRKNEEYWRTKLDARETDDTFYQHVFWHKSEDNRPINLIESNNASKMLSIHAAKGNGCECVYLLGLSEFTLKCHTNGIPNTLKYNSLLHVGVTRQKKYLYVGYDGFIDDDIAKRFRKYTNTTLIEPYIKDITPTIHHERMLDNELFYSGMDTIVHFETIRKGLLPDESEQERNQTVDWGDHIIRYCAMRVKMDAYLLSKSSALRLKFADLDEMLDDCKIVPVDGFNYSKKIAELNKRIKNNIKNYNKPPEKRSPPQKLFLFFLCFKKQANSEYYKYESIIESTIKKVQQKIRSRTLIFCPLESIVYCHLMELIQHPFTVRVSILDVYRLIACFDAANSDLTAHSATYQCVCYNFFKQKKAGVISSEELLQRSVANHYKALEKMNEILPVLTTQLDRIEPSMSIDYKYDKTIQYCNGEKNQFEIKDKFEYLGSSKKNVIFFVLLPQLNKMNFEQKLFHCITKNFLLQSCEDFEGKNVWGCMITLDALEPIMINLTEMLSQHDAVVKRLVGEFIFGKYIKEHPRILSFFKFYESSFTRMIDLLEKKESSRYVYNVPNYIRKSFEEMDRASEDEPVDPEKIDEFVTQNLEKSLKYDVKRFLHLLTFQTPII